MNIRGRKQSKKRADAVKRTGYWEVVSDGQVTSLVKTVFMGD